jgi:glutaredoxin 3
MNAVPVVIYATGLCPYCSFARRLLRKKGVAFEEIRIDREPQRRAEMTARAGRDSVPQIFVGEHHVGGYDDMAALERRGELDGLLQGH